jgi:hypothetical protein
VQDASDIIRTWARVYDLPQLDAMLRAAKQPSVSTRKLSTSAAKAAIRESNIADVLFSWRARIAAEDERRLMAIVERFQIDEYKAFDCTSQLGFRAPLSGVSRPSAAPERMSPCSPAEVTLSLPRPN